jgi:lambda repressor-like predicted transcriptional regulator
LLEKNAKIKIRKSNKKQGYSANSLDNILRREESKEK